MLAIVAFMLTIFGFILSYLLKEPEFLTQFADNNSDFSIRNENIDSFNLGVQLQIVASLRLFYRDIEKYKGPFIFILVAIVTTCGIFAIYDFLKEGTISNYIIGIYSATVLLFNIVLLLVALYAYLFGYIICKR
jgi:hypothetical protein